MNDASSAKLFQRKFEKNKQGMFFHNVECCKGQERAVYIDYFLSETFIPFPITIWLKFTKT